MQRDEGEAHLVVLAHDHALDVGDDLLAGLLDLASSGSLGDGCRSDGPIGGVGPAGTGVGRVGRSYARDGSPVPFVTG